MKTTGAKTTATIVFILTAICIVTIDAQPGARAAASRTSSARPARADSDTDSLLRRVRDVSDEKRTTLLPGESDARDGIRSVRTVDFYLKGGELVFGRLISEDRNKVIVEKVEGSSLVVETYSKRDMETRTLQARNVSASKFYTEMAEYFAGRTWDFKDDPDDFIQAIRFYERAKSLIEGASQLDRERAKEIESKIAELEADREVWKKQIEDRAKLKELEFQSDYETRFNQLQTLINVEVAKIAKSIADIDKFVADVQKNSDAIDKTIPAMEQDLRRRLDLLGAEVDANRRLLDPYGRYPRGNYGVRPRY